MNTTSPQSDRDQLSDVAERRGFLTRLGLALDDACSASSDPLTLVERCAPQLHQLIKEHPDEVEELVSALRWPDLDDDHYARQRILESPTGNWSVYGICWRPGQYTPVHDHGTWGVVGVLRGCLHEHLMNLVDQRGDEDRYELVPVGVCLLSEGAINTFIPEPDHIHRSGVPLSGQPTASIHLYGRVMTHYHAYNLETHTRSRLDVE